jgi:hypothetical protein
VCFHRNNTWTSKWSWNNLTHSFCNTKLIKTNTPDKYWWWLRNVFHFKSSNKLKRFNFRWSNASCFFLQVLSVLAITILNGKVFYSNLLFLYLFKTELIFFNTRVRRNCLLHLANGHLLRTTQLRRKRTHTHSNTHKHTHIQTHTHSNTNIHTHAHILKMIIFLTVQSTYCGQRS